MSNWSYSNRLRSVAKYRRISTRRLIVKTVKVRFMCVPVVILTLGNTICASAVFGYKIRTVQ